MVLAYFVNHLQLQDAGPSVKQRQQQKQAAERAAQAVAQSSGGGGRIITLPPTTPSSATASHSSRLFSSLLGVTSPQLLGIVNSSKAPQASSSTSTAAATTTNKYTPQSNEGEGLLGLTIPWSTYVELFNEVDSDWWIWLVVGIIALAIVGVCIAIVCWCALVRPRGGVVLQGSNVNNQSTTEQTQSSVVKRVFFHGRPNESRMSLSTISTPSELNTPIPRRRSPPPAKRFYQSDRRETVIKPRPLDPPPMKQAPLPPRAPTQQVIIKQVTPQVTSLPMPPMPEKPPLGAPALPNVNKEISQSFAYNRPGYYERGYKY